MKKLLVLAAMIAFVVGCGKSEPVAPTAPNVAVPAVEKKAVVEVDTAEAKAKVEDAAKKVKEGATEVGKDLKKTVKDTTEKASE